MNPLTLKLYVQAMAFEWLIWGGAIALAVYAAVTLFRANKIMKRLLDQ